jgi:hypothetical protein
LQLIQPTNAHISFFFFFVSSSSPGAVGKWKAVGKRRAGEGVSARRRAAAGIAIDDNDGDSPGAGDNLRALRFRIIRLLGRMGGMGEGVVGADRGIGAAGAGGQQDAGGSAADPGAALSTAPSDLGSLALPLPLGDGITLQLPIAPLLPRLLHLAAHSPRRSVKVAAGEMVHAVTQYVIGRGHQDCVGAAQPVTGKRTRDAAAAGGKSKASDAAADAADAASAVQGSGEHIPLLRYLIPHLLRLASDADTITSTLFRDIVMQGVRWWGMIGGKEGELLLDASFGAVAQGTDAALRALAAGCLVEFLRWSVKRVAYSAAAAGRLGGIANSNIRALLKRLFALLTHPSHPHRLGALESMRGVLNVFRERGMGSIAAREVECFWWGFLFFLIRFLSFSKLFFKKNNIKNYPNSSPRSAGLSRPRWAV